MNQRHKSYERRIRTALILYAVWCVVVLLLTLRAGTRANIFRVSMSAMGNMNRTNYMFFIVWTIVFCSYFGSLTGFILILTQHAGSRIRIFVLIAVGIMIFGDIVPFVPEQHPFWAFLHNTCAQISSLSLAFSLMLLVLTVRRGYPELYRRALIWVVIIWCFLLAGMSLVGTKALTEMMGIIGGSVFLLIFARDVVRQKRFSASAALSASDAREAAEEAEKLEKRARELHEEYMEAEAKARHARMVAEDLRRLERRNRSQGSTV
ncbi:MAG: hypothetical protein HDQ87_05300 [Clostridia bacterium]|nr:hypothetical protein [Clostridia bacterium]